MKALLALAAGALLAGCTSEDTARRALDGAGYSDVRLRGPSPWGCGKDDLVGQSFSATGPSGRSVTGVVCSGLLKGATVRTD